MVRKNEKGSITLFTLIAMMFLLTIAFTAYASAMIKLQAQNEDLDRIKASYEQDLTEEGLRELYNRLTGTREWLPGDGTEQNPYKIYMIEDLLTLSNRVNAGENYSGKYIELMNDLDFNNVKSYEKYDRTDFGDVNENGIIEELRTELTTGEGWQAIGTDSKRFKGFFDGKNNEIKNLHINTSKNYQGIFGFGADMTIQNLNVEGNITSTGAIVGGIVGQIGNNSVIDNCKNFVKIENINNLQSETSVGGITGYLQPTSIIRNCKNYAEISSTSITTGRVRIGGIVGTTNGQIYNCNNSGEIYGKSSNTDYSNVGGIAGDNINSIIKCCNSGKIIGEALRQPLIGGIVGVNKKEVKNCYNIGEIVSLRDTPFAGGIVGDNYQDNATVTKCYSISNIIVNNVIRGRVVGSHVGAAKTQNSYGADDYIAICGSTSNVIDCALMSRETIKLQSFVDLLNLNNDEQPWIMDTANLNDGYPILKWQLNQ